jgi:hypothetical protein
VREPSAGGLAFLARYRHKRRWYLNDLLATALGTARLGRSMLGDALDALESLIAPHAAIAVGRHGSLPHEDEDCGSRIYANRQRLTCLQQRGCPKNRFLSAFMPDRAVPMTTNDAREAVSQYRSKPLPALLNSPGPKARGLRAWCRAYSRHHLVRGRCKPDQPTAGSSQRVSLVPSGSSMPTMSATAP